jgi:hypothetical protein
MNAPISDYDLGASPAKAVIDYQLENHPLQGEVLMLPRGLQGIPAVSFNHLISAGEERGRDRQVEGFGRCYVDR